MMIDLNVSKTKFVENINWHIQKIQIKEIPYSSTQKVNKKKTEIFVDDRVKSFTNNNMEGTIL